MLAVTDAVTCAAMPRSAKAKLAWAASPIPKVIDASAFIATPIPTM